MKVILSSILIGLFICGGAQAQVDEELGAIYRSLDDPCDFQAFAEAYSGSAYAPMAAKRGETCGEGTVSETPQKTALPWGDFTSEDLLSKPTRELAERALETYSGPELKAAAESGNTTAQNIYGYALRRGLGDLKADESRGIYWVTRSCNEGNPRGCLGVAFAHAMGTAVPKNMSEAFRRFEALCNEGQPLACEQIGQFYANGIAPVSRDYARALAAYNKACEGKVAAGCRGAAVRYLNGEGTQKDILEALKSYVNGCLYGSNSSCTDGARMLERERTEAADDNATFAYLKNLYGLACGREDAQSCYKLGDIYKNGLYSQPADGPKGFEFMEKACTLGNDDGCYNAGTWLITGAAGRLDGIRAIELMSPLCLRDTPDLQACNNAGTAAFEGIGMEAPDYVSARRFYEQACYQGALVQSCRTLANMLAQGQGGPADVGETEWLNAQLCFKDGDDAYCKRSELQYQIYSLAQHGEYADAKTKSGELCATGDRLACSFQKTFNLCPSNSETRRACAKLFE